MRPRPSSRLVERAEKGEEVIIARGSKPVARLTRLRSTRPARRFGVMRELRFDLVVWVGDMDDSRRRELYRPARLTLDDVAFLVIGAT